MAEMQSAISDNTYSQNQLSRNPLEGAFQLFNQMSAQLTESNQQLQAQLVTLNKELTAACNDMLFRSFKCITVLTTGVFYA